MKNCMFILVLVGLALYSRSVAAQGQPKLIPAAGPLPAEIVAAWKNAGAETCLMADGPLTLVIRPEGSVDPLPLLPAFQFGDAWKVGQVAKLPAPATPFGLSFVHMTDAGLKELAALAHLQMLDLRTANVTDAGMKELAPLTNLQSLKLGYRVTDKGLKTVASFTSLKALYLLGGDVSDAGLKELTGLKHLQRLSLRNTSVTDKGLKDLSVLKNLQMLDLYSTKVTDVGLKEFASRKGLQLLELTKTRVTDIGVQELRKALPGCKINFRKKK